MTQWLSHQEKVAMFESYLKDYHRTEVEREEEEQDILHQENVILLFLVLFTNSATMYTIWI